MAGVILQSREGSDRRVAAKSGKCRAENELENALLHLTVRATSGASSFTLRWCVRVSKLVVSVSKCIDTITVLLAKYGVRGHEPAVVYSVQKRTASNEHQGPYRH